MKLEPKLDTIAEALLARSLELATEAVYDIRKELLSHGFARTHEGMRRLAAAGDELHQARIELGLVWRH